MAIAEVQVQQAQTQGRAVVAGIRAAYNNLKLTMDHVTEGIAKLKASLATLDKTQAQRELAEAELRRAKQPAGSLNSGTQQVVDQRRPPYQVAVATETRGPSSRFTWQLRRTWPAPLSTSRSSARRRSHRLARKANSGGSRGARRVDQRRCENRPGSSLRIEEDPDTVYINFVKRAPGGDLDVYLNRLSRNLRLCNLPAAGRGPGPPRVSTRPKLDLRDTKIHASSRGVYRPPDRDPGNRVRRGKGSWRSVRSRTSGSTPTSRKPRSRRPAESASRWTICADAYPDRVYRGRISGFSAGTGASTALLPPENATGNFVKVVQRLPVRIDLVDGNPPDAPLFVGLSVEPIREESRNRRRDRSRARSSNVPAPGRPAIAAPATIGSARSPDGAPTAPPKRRDGCTRDHHHEAAAAPQPAW